MKRTVQISPLDKEEADERIKNGADPNDFYLEIDDEGVESVSAESDKKRRR